MWPNLFIVGAQKAGTTSLYEYLKEIPNVYMSSVKEPGFFSLDISKIHWTSHIRDEKEYLDLFRDVNDEKIIGEASSIYLSDPKSPQLIHEKIQKAKIIIMIRNPIERLFSSYLMLKRNGRTDLSFHKNLKERLSDINNEDYRLVDLARGIYYEPTIRYIETFGRENVKIIIFEEFINDPKSIFQDVLKFLDIEYDLENFEFQAHNQFVVSRNKILQLIAKNKVMRKGAKKLLTQKSRLYLREKIAYKKDSRPEMEKEDRKLLQHFYSEDVNKVKKLLNRDLPWPDF